MTPRHVLTGLGAAAVLTMACSLSCTEVDHATPPPATSTPGPTTGAAPEPTASPDAATIQVVERLRAGTAFIDRTSFRTRTNVDSQYVTVAHTDNVRRRADVLQTSPGQFLEIRLIDSAVYLLVGQDLPGVGKGWMTLDPARIPSGFRHGFAPGKNDPGGSVRLINAIVSATVFGNQITGTMDLARVGVGNGFSFTFRIGDPEAAHRQPFTASLDNQGRLTWFAIQEGNGVPQASLSYSEFGAPVEVSPPPNPTPAPEALYDLLGRPV